MPEQPYDNSELNDYEAKRKFDHHDRCIHSHSLASGYGCVLLHSVEHRIDHFLLHVWGDPPPENSA